MDSYYVYTSYSVLQVFYRTRLGMGKLLRSVPNLTPFAIPVSVLIFHYGFSIIIVELVTRFDTIRRKSYLET